MQPKAAINVPWVVVAVVAVLIVIHVMLWILGLSWQAWFYYAFSFIPERLGGGRVIPRIPGSEVWTFFTYTILHADKFHLGTNCLWLAVFSTPVARRLGPARYLAFLMATAAAGAAASLLLHWGQFVFVVGASACVSGALAAAMPIMFAPGFSSRLQNDGDYQSLHVLSPRQLLASPRALVFTSVFLLLTLLSGTSILLTGTAFLEERSVAWEAHLGGFLMGLLAFYFLDRRTASHSPYS